MIWKSGLKGAFFAAALEGKNRRSDVPCKV